MPKSIVLALVKRFRIAGFNRAYQSHSIRLTRKSGFRAQSMIFAYACAVITVIK
ncbi:hypothetical protein H6F50_25525 [Coleofasciculus sp. FACHB-712]|uniref:hypothetical protein n=1 Tax=Cyanophyceae TaxID=3028117 RepID=UPI001684C62A|nr:hypothetical protein [Coleofasciculus sp. FACHB-712]MBD1945672.1 hypothetical protein [Coleofasciculus sp. FACHB-712]